MTTPLVSCLCVTEGRPAFMPWLLWSYARQSHERRELVVIDGSVPVCRCKREDVRVIAMPRGTNVLPLQSLRDAVGVEAWANTDEQLASLRGRLREAALLPQGVTLSEAERT